MWSRRLAYLGVLLAGGLFFIFFRGYLSYYVFLFLLALPVLSFLWLLASSFFVRVRVEADHSAAERREPFSFSGTARSSRFLPVPCLRLTLRVSNVLGGEAETESLLFSVFGGEMSASQLCRSSCCGKVVCAVRSARALDFLRLFSLPVRSGEPASVFVLPSRAPAPALVSELSLLPGFGELTLPSQPGDDFSEPFDVREYREGDALSRIHWKLTQKERTLMVREGGRSASRSLRFLIEYGADLRDTDCVLETFSRLAFLLAEHGVPAEVCWEGGGVLHTASFRGEEEASDLLGLLLSREPGGGVSALTLLSGEPRWKCAHLLYLTPDASGDCLSALAEEESAARFTVLLCGSRAQENSSPAVIPVLPDQADTCLAEVEL